MTLLLLSAWTRESDFAPIFHLIKIVTIIYPLKYMIWNVIHYHPYAKWNTKIYRRNSGLWFNIKMTSYQYRKSRCGDKTILRPSYLHNGISYTGKMTSLYWIRNQGPDLSSTTDPHAGAQYYLSGHDLSKDMIYLDYANQILVISIQSY